MVQLQHQPNSNRTHVQQLLQQEHIKLMKKAHLLSLLIILTGCQLKIESKTLADTEIELKNSIKTLENKLQLNYETQAAYLQLIELETDSAKGSNLSSYYRRHKEDQALLQTQLQEAKTRLEQLQNNPISNLENQQ